MTNEQIIQYYVSLLIMQYVGTTNVQTINFSDVPASGNFQFNYGTLTSPNVAWNANTSTIASVISELTGISNVTVTGSLASKTIVVTLGNTNALILGTNTGTLQSSGFFPITTVTSGYLVKAAMLIQALTKLAIMNQLPLIAQNAFNLIPTVQTITFSAVPVTGTFSIIFSVTSTPTMVPSSTLSIPYNASNQTIQNFIQAILPSGTVVVTGGMSEGAITLTFSGVNPSIVSASVNTLGVTYTVTTNLAYGQQLDWIGKYVGVTRYGYSAAGPITLSDSDFYTLIQLGIIRNNFGSSLAVIQSLLATFFNGQIYVFDYRNMQMSYVVNLSHISTNVLYCFISQNLLPKPMGVLLGAVVAVPDVTHFFSFVTGDFPNENNGTPFNSAGSINLDSPWVNGNDVIGV